MNGPVNACNARRRPCSSSLRRGGPYIKPVPRARMHSSRGQSLISSPPPPPPQPHPVVSFSSQPASSHCGQTRPASPSLSQLCLRAILS
ncbi:hypothetical protein ASPCADRAFT_128927 [Aspergillus carbonarius ITEM 5010]|uniref:Uncharacterized protein n=1 Tax=Aspergillus carbonarius (strain ITEM 5010) TaxID=602072 RepID=A0A1R3RRU8_ASPC5|nr:hypothetical protein ASPCADRAFT_128927 [Aspergillus carbonarius ITEM 5010]